MVLLGKGERSIAEGVSYSTTTMLSRRERVHYVYGVRRRIDAIVKVRSLTASNMSQEAASVHIVLNVHAIHLYPLLLFVLTLSHSRRVLLHWPQETTGRQLVWERQVRNAKLGTFLILYTAQTVQLDYLDPE